MVQLSYYWLCIPVAMLVFWGMPDRFRFWFLGAASFLFVTFIEFETALTMLAISALVYQLSSPTQTWIPSRLALWIPISVLLAYLFYFKYLPAIFTLSDGYSFTALLLPLGISYFTFKLIHYVIENRRGTLPEHDFGDYLSFVFLVPIFTAGPIQRFDLYMSQRTARWDNQVALEGMQRIALGLIKTFALGYLLTRGMSAMGISSAQEIFRQFDTIHPFMIVLFLACSYLVVYLDFAGYTDIAIGTSRLFGLRIMENFNFPFLAPNIGNLWKRWHMSLANWCQSYIYMPMLGLSRNPYAAVFSSFLVMGLWHAASLNWVAWGLYNAMGVSAYQWFSANARRRKWSFAKTRGFAALGYPATFLFFSGSFAFTMTDKEHGLWGAVRLLAKCFFIDL